MSSKKVIEYCLDQATAVIVQLRPEQFAFATPCTEWDARTVAQHMLYELLWAGDILNGKTIAEVGNQHEGDIVGADIAESWQAALKSTRKALKKAKLADAAHLSYGTVTKEFYGLEFATDMLLHAWDLGQGIDVTVTFDPKIATALYENALPKEDMIKGSGLFAPSLPVADDADPQTRLLALFGRCTEWAERAEASREA